MLNQTQDLKNQILERASYLSNIFSSDVRGELKKLERKIGFTIKFKELETFDETIERLLLRKDLNEYQLEEIDKFIDFVIDNYLEDEFEVCEEFPPMET